MVRPPDFTLHMAKKTEVDMVSRLEDLGMQLPWRPKLCQVYLVKEPRLDHFFLAATDGTVVRLQRAEILPSREALLQWSEDRGALDFSSSVGIWIEPKGSEILPDLSYLPLRIGKRAVAKNAKSTWELGAYVADMSDMSAQRVVPLIQGHIRPFPTAFRPWLFMLTVETMAKFSATFIGGLEPPVVWISEPQMDLREPSLGITWAKYWAYHTKSMEPLGVILGVAAPGILQTLKK
jgi:hypothetical protein